MTGRRVVDFDAALLEALGEPPAIVAFGETITLPPELPAIVPLTRQAALAGGNPDAEDKDIWALLAMVVGRPQVDAWIEVHRIGVEGAWLLVNSIAKAYRDEPDPEPPAPKTGPNRATKKAAARSTTSSKRGTSSKRTSNASTGSTPRKR